MFVLLADKDPFTHHTYNSRTIQLSKEYIFDSDQWRNQKLKWIHIKHEKNQHTSVIYIIKLTKIFYLICWPLV